MTVSYIIWKITGHTTLHTHFSITQTLCGTHLFTGTAGGNHIAIILTFVQLLFYKTMVLSFTD